MKEMIRVVVMVMMVGVVSGSDGVFRKFDHEEAVMIAKRAGWEFSYDDKEFFLQIYNKEDKKTYYVYQGDKFWKDFKTRKVVDAKDAGVRPKKVCRKNAGGKVIGHRELDGSYRLMHEWHWNDEMYWLDELTGRVLKYGSDEVVVDFWGSFDILNVVCGVEDKGKEL